MNASLFDSSSVHTQLHIEDLRREASQRRLVERSRKRTNRHRRPAAIRLQRAPAR
jgi:hypothetical protein